MLALASRGSAPCPVIASADNAALTPRPERHDPKAVAADFDCWSSGLRSLLSDRFPRPVRRAARRRDQGCTGSHFSPLMAAERQWESPDEARLCLLGDVSPAWWGYWCQVLTVPYEHEGRARRAHPDFLVRLANGSFVIFEVKPASRLARDTERHAAIARACAAHGVAYRVVTDTWLQAQPRLGNAAALHTAWDVPVTDDMVEHVARVVRDEQPTTLGALASLGSMKGLQRGTTLACALRGAFLVDLEHEPLGDASLIGPSTSRTSRRLPGARGRSATTVRNLRDIRDAA